MMICKECQEQGLKSKVYSRGTMSTAMSGGLPFWDEEGVLHIHDGNWVTTGYQCSNGHNWTTRNHRPCPSCDYGKEEG